MRTFFVTFSSRPSKGEPSAILRDFPASILSKRPRCFCRVEATSRAEATSFSSSSVQAAITVEKMQGEGVEAASVGKT